MNDPIKPSEIAALLAECHYRYGEVFVKRVAPKLSYDGARFEEIAVHFQALLRVKPNLSMYRTEPAKRVTNGYPIG